jgi:uncharacterized protein (DUF885 family)
LTDLEEELIAYTPEELIKLAGVEYDWCENEMKKASRELGFGDSWRDAVEAVKKTYVAPGKQIKVIKDLIVETTDFVTKHDLVTVPQLASETWRMFMMSPADQKVNPFFLGGSSIIVSYPTNTMEHKDKMMSMRGNNPNFSRSTAFHEMIPGHRLQFFMMRRHRPYRQVFFTPFSTEGWAFYWEMVLWDDERFHKTPAQRVGMLFWRMHRCIRIIFSLKFHLGLLTAEQCIDLLVEKVGHERANAEGEVRRSFNGDYSPLYQCAYMLGALQYYALRTELVKTGKIPEKEFHDRILQGGSISIELFRALVTKTDLDPKFHAKWRFYDNIKH